MEKTRHDPKRPSEIAGDGSQRRAEEHGQLHGAGAQILVEQQSAQHHAQHDGRNVPGMFAEGGKADDGHDPADGGPVQITAGNQDKHDADEPVDAHVDQYRGGAQHAQVIAGGAAGSLEQASVARPGRPNRALAEKEPCCDKHDTHAAHGRPQREIIAGGPVVIGGQVGPHGAHHRGQDQGQQPAGKAHVVQIHSVLDLIGIGREGRQDKADQYAHQNACRQIAPAVVQRHIADHRRERGSQQRDRRVRIKGLSP